MIPGSVPLSFVFHARFPGGAVISVFYSLLIFLVICAKLSLELHLFYMIVVLRCVRFCLRHLEVGALALYY